MKFYVYLRGGAVVALSVPDDAADKTVRYLEQAVNLTSPHDMLNWGEKPGERVSIATCEIVAFSAVNKESLGDSLLKEHNALLRKVVDSMDSGEDWRGD